MRTEEQLIQSLQQYGHPTKLGSTICLNGWYLNELSELLQMEHHDLIYQAIIASHEREQYDAHYFGTRAHEVTQVTKEKIIALIESLGTSSEDQGVLFLDGREVGNIDMLLQFPGMGGVIRRVAFVASSKPEIEAECYEISTDGQRLPQAMKVLLNSLSSGL